MKKVSDRIKSLQKKSLDDVKKEILKGVYPVVKNLFPSKDAAKENPPKKYGSGGYGRSKSKG